MHFSKINTAVGVYPKSDVAAYNRLRSYFTYIYWTCFTCWKKLVGLKNVSDIILKTPGLFSAFDTEVKKNNFFYRMDKL